MNCEGTRVIAVGAGAAQLSIIALDLQDTTEALKLAKKVANGTGRTVTVRNQDGEILGVFRGILKN